MKFINWNGTIVIETTPIVTAQNRSLRYGDGLFETLVAVNAKPLLWESHAERLWKGLSKMRFTLPDFFTKSFLEFEIHNLLKKNNHLSKFVKVRINVIRGNAGIFDIESLHPTFIIESWDLSESIVLNQNGLLVGLFEDAQKICDQFSNLKHNNYLPYSMGALFAKENNFNDAIILNQYGRVTDTCIANIFFIKNKVIFTPSLTEGCVAGTIRNRFIQTLPAIGYSINETEVYPEDLLGADEIFLTNSVAPIKWVASMQNKNYSNNEIINIYEQLHQILPEYYR